MDGAGGEADGRRPPGGTARLAALLVYGSSGLLAAGAGVLLAGLNDGADLGIAGPLLLPSIAAVLIGVTSVLGSTGGYAVTIVGVLILTVLDSLMTIVGAGPGLRQLVYASIILVLAAVFGRTDPMRAAAVSEWGGPREAARRRVGQRT
jgi:ribose/xylose/arabinose/galactoside ABC-type transport system permease subunit